MQTYYHWFLRVTNLMMSCDIDITFDKSLINILLLQMEFSSHLPSQPLMCNYSERFIITKYIYVCVLEVLILHLFLLFFSGSSWSWSYGSWIYNYLYNQCLSPLTLWVRILLRWGVLDTLCDKLVVFSLGTLVSSITHPTYNFSIFFSFYHWQWQPSWMCHVKIIDRNLWTLNIHNFLNDRWVFQK